MSMARIGSVLLAALTLFVNASCQDTKTRPQDWRRYFPLAVGNEWHYDVDVRSAASRLDKKTDKVTEMQAVDGVDCFVMESRTNGRLMGKEHLQIDENVLLARKKEVRGVTVSLTTPELQLTFPLTSGRTWQWQGELPGGLRATMKYRVTGEQVVDVPAGRFTAVTVVLTGWETEKLRVKEWFGNSPNVKVDVEPVLERTMWLAADVGLVKETLKVKNVVITSELTDYSVGE
ncbi:MAG: hypothetical protein ACYS8X_05390 [Planctomycetota bacterium]|jgi:hypothetical protein